MLCKSIAKTRNVPFPRPCGATGKDAQKLHAPSFVRFRGAAILHEVLFHTRGEAYAEEITGETMVKPD